MRRKLKKVICLLSCAFLFAMPFCFMASAETSYASSFRDLNYLSSQLYSDRDWTTDIPYDLTTEYSSSSFNVTMKRTASNVSALSGHASSYNSAGIVNLTPGMKATLSWTVTLVCSGATSGYTSECYSSIGNSRFSVSGFCDNIRTGTWAVYYDYHITVSYEQAGALIDRVIATAKLSSGTSSLIGFNFSSINVTVTDSSDTVNDIIIGNVDPANPPQYSPPAANDAISNLDALQSQLDNAKKSWNPMLFDLTGFGNAFSGLRLAFDSIVGSFGSDFGVVLKVSIIFGCVSLLVGLVINASVSSIESEQRQARENAHERERNSYKQYKLNRYRKETYAAQYVKEKNAWKRGNK